MSQPYTIGSQAEVADSRRTEPPSRAAARLAARWSAAPTTVRPTWVVAPVAGPAMARPMPPWADASPSRSTSSGSSSGRRNRSTAGIAAPKSGSVGLAHGTAGQDDPQARVRRLELGQLALPADHLLLGGLADRAGVDHDQIGRLESARLVAAGGQQAAGHLLRVAPVHLAAEGPDGEARQDRRLRAVFVDTAVRGESVPIERDRPAAGPSRASAGRGSRLAAQSWAVTGSPDRWASASSSRHRRPRGTQVAACISAYEPVSPW